MTNESSGHKRRVSRQSWKPSKMLQILHGIWMAAYSVLKIAGAAVATVLLIVVVCGFAFVGILASYLENDIIPQADQLLEDYELDQNSYVYYVDSKGDIQVLQKLYSENNSQWATLDEIPEDLIHAAVSIEDKRFYEHQGVDWFTTIKACINMFLGADSHFGGSSITQQLVKNITNEDSVTVQRKVLEIFRATELERRYDKDTILEWYLNNIYLGQRRYGVKAAAEIYFGKEVESLTTAECAALISITNNPSKYDPYRESLDKDGKTGFEQNTARKESTLTEMYELGWIDREKYEEAMTQEIVLKWGVDDEDRISQCENEKCGYRDTVKTFELRDDGHYYCPVCGTVTNIGEDASQEYYSYFTDTVIEDVCRALAEKDGITELTDEQMKFYKKLVSGGGYHIYSTLDMDIQNAIDNIYTNLEEIPEDRSVQQLQSAMIIIDNKSGDIVGMVGGVGEKTTHDGLNRATDSYLQTGSSMKPITVYGPAFDLGIITPASSIDDFPMYYDDTTGNPFPRNATNRYEYKISALTAVVWSVNTAAVRVLDTIGTGYSYNFAKYKMRLSSLTDYYVNSSGQVFSDVNLAPLGLGAPSVGVTVRDVAGAYSAIANNGIYREARTFTKVYDSEGNLVIDNTQDREQILGQKAVDYLTYTMDAATAWGTGVSGQIPGHSVASKTGTTNDEKARWYCGFTGQYTAVVWTGYDIPEQIVPVENINVAGVIWKKVMEPIHENLENAPLYDDSHFTLVSICTDCGKIATSACYHDPRAYLGAGRVEQIKLYEEDIPVDVCDCHVEVEFCAESNCVANEYCQKLGAAGQLTLLERSVTKITTGQLEMLRLAYDHQLYGPSRLDNWIYLVDERGKDQNFLGINGDINKDVNAPYQVCTEHTEEDWIEYLKSIGEYEEEESVKPSNPEDETTEPTDKKPTRG